MAVSMPAEAGAGVPPQNDEAEVAVLGTILLTEQALDQIFVDLKLTADDFYRPRHQLIFRAMMRLKEKAEPEAVDAITVCDDLKRSKPARGGRRRPLHPLTADDGPRRGRGARLREDRPRPRGPAPAARGRARDPGQGRDRGRRPAHARRAGRAGDLPRRPRPGLLAAPHDRGRPARGDRQARAPLQGGPEPHRHPIRLPRPRRHHRRLPARQPDRPGGKTGYGQIGACHQHRRERRGRSRQGGGAVLARDVRGRAGAALHRVAGEDQRRVAAQGAGQGRPLAEAAAGDREARALAAVRRRLERPRRARAAREGAATAPAPRRSGC